jgi:hypothetical protein
MNSFGAAGMAASPAGSHEISLERMTIETINTPCCAAESIGGL